MVRGRKALRRLPRPRFLGLHGSQNQRGSVPDVLNQSEALTANPQNNVGASLSDGMR